ncbi:MAG: helix-turn-helix transcriptional regulator [Candidatus Hydrogenedentes bacterium]|nr:helix-turn-helix transcriptional regulator [Candidatus Hydrogenedentota bacterium]
MQRHAMHPPRKAPKRAKDEIQLWSPLCTERFFPMRVGVAEPLRAFQIVQAGRCILYPGYYLHRKRSVYHLALYTSAGLGQIRGDGRAWRVEPNTLMLAPARAGYEYKPLRPRWRFVWFHLEDSGEWEHLKERGVGVRRTTLTTQIHHTAHGYMSEAARSHASAIRAAHLYALLITALLERDLRSGLTARSQEVEEQLQALWERVADDLKRRWTVPQLAAHLHVSVPHFHRLVVANEGTSPIQMLTRLRMLRAQELLAGYTLSIRDVAEQIGYDNEFAFSTAFKRFAGIPPREFRSRYG